MPPCLFLYILQYKAYNSFVSATDGNNGGDRHYCTNRLPLGYCRSQSVVKLVATFLSLSLESSLSFNMFFSKYRLPLARTESRWICLQLQLPISVNSSGSPFRQPSVLWDRHLAFRSQALPGTIPGFLTRLRLR
ncbi:hypothetical protein Hanom_Chr10g00959461 [Helianthus anomalus]